MIDGGPVRAPGPAAVAGHDPPTVPWAAALDLRFTDGTAFAPFRMTGS